MTTGMEMAYLVFEFSDHIHKYAFFVRNVCMYIGSRSL